MGTSSSGQGHETLVATVVGEILEREPDTIRVVHADSLTALPSNSPVGSRMAIMLGGAAAGAARKLKARLGAKRSIWFGLGTSGLIGWSVTVPTLLGAGLGATAALLVLPLRSRQPLA